MPLGLDRRLAVVWFPTFALLAVGSLTDRSQLFGVETSLIGAVALITFFGWGGVVNIADGEWWVALGFFVMATEFLVAWSVTVVPGGKATIYVVTTTAVFLILLGDRVSDLAARRHSVPE